MHNNDMDEQRREFIKTAGKATAVAPAVSLLLAGGAIPRSASANVYSEAGSAEVPPLPASAADPLIPQPPLLYPEKKLSE